MPSPVEMQPIHDGQIPGAKSRGDVGDRCACMALVLCVLGGFSLLAWYVMNMPSFQ
jgi:hypothetical protein